MTPTTHAYIGINQIGSVRAIVFDDPGCEDSTAEIVAEWIRNGKKVERVTIQDGLERMKDDNSALTPPDKS